MFVPNKKFSEETLCVSSFPTFDRPKTFFILFSMIQSLSSLWPILLGGFLNTKLLNEQIDTSGRTFLLSLLLFNWGVVGERVEGGTTLLHPSAEGGGQ